MLPAAARGSSGDLEEFEFSAPAARVGYRLSDEELRLYGGARRAAPWEEFRSSTAALVETPLPEWTAVPRGIFLPPEPERRSLWRRLKEGFDKNIVLTGYQTFTYNMGDVSGNLASYNDDNYGNEREFNSTSEFYIRGKLFNYFDVDMTLSRNRFM